MSIYAQGLMPAAVNHVALTPLSFIERTAAVYGNYPAVIHGAIRRNWQETYQRCRRLASALAGRGIGRGDTVAVMLPNTPTMLEAHFGVPMTGAVLNTLNVRLDAEAIAFMLQHGEAKVLITDREFHAVIEGALALLEHPPLVVDVDDPEYGEGRAVSQLDYEALLNEGDPEFAWEWPDDEWQAISLNYTSGTTGNPKGVVYHHRGAYLNALGNQMTWAMGHRPVYLWTLPMFHCNGWCYPWTITALAGTHVFLRRVDPQKILTLIREHKVSHLCGAPIVLNALVNMPEAAKAAIEHPVQAMVAGAAPPAKVIGAVEQMGIKVTHTYGLTEVYGPVTVCAWHDEWDALSLEERARIKSRQGVRYPTLDGLMVADPQTLQPVPRDGDTLGEIFMRGNTVMKGYLKNPEATAEAFRGGWFHTGDLAVWHADGYIEIKDRLKDIIISGGENISTIEVEDALYKHSAVLEAAVVARPDEKWGETPCAFVALKPGREDTREADITSWCREHLAGFKVPKTVVFGELPKTSTGKIQKYVLRDRAKAL
ncbi:MULTISPECIES: acyl-CoA synthetase [Pseudomonas]|jgi:fatty-acyl-CoA synthase|uniref:AMP-binding domain protein n=2 Tax=Pseudomonas putida group TaxID=136845 RepID=Q88H12_PSEPK|nr:MULTISPECIES: AMP-binding protein [Pseudomonas]AAN69154.1 AMP-binding domain protein [Pseudomonas putida KT2440]KMU96204.1 acyl-CoA synthetase [Pseudomonas putida]KMY33502.1 acyl-CoA synthetase [Pseudomonas putida]MBP2843087.1 acyl-CoA synthetase [Pseudomonas sp. PNP]MCE0864913.1 acyl-CoA synthetase [Pseudomonas alloputida]